MSDAGRWSVEQGYVQAAIAWIVDRKRGVVTTEQLVEWDRVHGRKLFTWDDVEAAREYRLAEARRFLNHFVVQFQGMRARAFYNVPKSDEAGIKKQAYIHVERVTENEVLRDLVLQQLTRRIVVLTKQVKFLEVTPVEAEAVLREVRLALGLEEAAAVAG